MPGQAEEAVPILKGSPGNSRAVTPSGPLLEEALPCTTSLAENSCLSPSPLRSRSASLHWPRRGPRSAARPVRPTPNVSSTDTSVLREWKRLPHRASPSGCRPAAHGLGPRNGHRFPGGRLRRGTTPSTDATRHTSSTSRRSDIAPGRLHRRRHRDSRARRAARGRAEHPLGRARHGPHQHPGGRFPDGPRPRTRASGPGRAAASAMLADREGDGFMASWTWDIGHGGGRPGGRPRRPRSTPIPGWHG